MKLIKKVAFLLVLAIIFSMTFGHAFLIQPVAIAGKMQFFVLEGPWTSENARYELWKSKAADSIDQVKLPDGQYLLGISRKIDQKDVPFIDTTYSYPSPFAKGTSQKIMTDTNKEAISINFNPESATATIAILDGIICWNWHKGIFITHRTGQKGVLAYLLGVDEGNRDPLLPPLNCF